MRPSLAVMVATLCPIERVMVVKVVSKSSKHVTLVNSDGLLKSQHFDF
jgi:hypothetical protein